ETLALALAQAGEKDEQAGEGHLGRRLLVARGSPAGDRARPLAQRARIGIALRVGPEPGAVAEYARRLAVPYAVHGSPPWPRSIRPPSAHVKAGNDRGSAPRPTDDLRGRCGLTPWNEAAKTPPPPPRPR